MTAHGRSAPSAGTSAPGVLRALVRTAPLALPLLTLAAEWVWLDGVIASPERATIATRDWVSFYETGRRLVEGELSAIYPRTSEPVYPWLYPPFCIWATAPLGLLSPFAAYIACMVAQTLSVLLALRVLHTALAATGRERLVIALFTLGSMPFATTLIVGQASGFFLLTLAIALWGWQRGHGFVTGLSLALLFAKPNLAIVPTILAVVTKQRRVLAGIAVGTLLLLVATLPLGLERWAEFIGTVLRYNEVQEARMPLAKQLTLYAFLRTVLGANGELLAATVWLLVSAVLVTLTLAAWRSRWPGDATLRPRLLGVAVLLMITANVHLLFYDGLLLTVPAVAWYLARDSYGQRVSSRIIGGCFTVLFVGGWILTVGYGVHVVWLAPLLPIWLVAETADILIRHGPIGETASVAS